jgi:hypothetical protein
VPDSRDTEIRAISGVDNPTSTISKLLSYNEIRASGAVPEKFTAPQKPPTNPMILVPPSQCSKLLVLPRIIYPILGPQGSHSENDVPSTKIEAKEGYLGVHFMPSTEVTSKYRPMANQVKVRLYPTIFLFSTNRYSTALSWRLASFPSSPTCSRLPLQRLRRTDTFDSIVQW